MNVMGENWQMVDRNEIDAERAAVLSDPVFVRSPVLARLLDYLVTATLDGRGQALKSYVVAVDGLGKDPSIDPQGDTNARVQVARLRKALDIFYAAGGRYRPLRLVIDNGSYAVRLVPNDLPLSPEEAPAAASVKPPGDAAPCAARSLERRRFWPWGVACLVVLLTVAAIALWRHNADAAQARWRTSNFPTVTVSVQHDQGDVVRDGYYENLRSSMILKLAQYEGLRVNYGEGKSADYNVVFDIYRTDRGDRDNVFVIDNSSGRVIFSRTYKDDGAGDMATNDATLSTLSFIISHPTGIIHANQRKRNYDEATPYGCWLRFTSQFQASQTIGDPLSARCAHDWYASAPNHPLAAALYSWSLVDRSLTQLTDARRGALLREAVQTAEGAVAINPNSAFVRVAAMRAYAFVGDRAALNSMADSALRLAPNNLDVQGVAGLMLTLQDDPRGEVLLKDAITRHFNPPPWYFVGSYVAAMMRDDPAGAGAALARVHMLRHANAVTPVLTAAWQARLGQLARARASWDQAKRIQPVLRLSPDQFFNRLPMAAPERERLKIWLGPVLK